MRTVILAACVALGALAAGPLEAQYVSNPIGTVIAMGTKFCPDQWAKANGQVVPISQYPYLFPVIGTTYGGNGQTTFGLPNLTGGTFGPTQPPMTWCIATVGPIPLTKPAPMKSKGKP